MGMMINLLNKINTKYLYRIKVKANEIINNMDSY